MTQDNSQRFLLCPSSPSSLSLFRPSSPSSLSLFCPGIPLNILESLVEVPMVTKLEMYMCFWTFEAITVSFPDSSSFIFHSCPCNNVSGTSAHVLPQLLFFLFRPVEKQAEACKCERERHEKAWKRPQAVAKLISVSWVVPAEQITLELLKLYQFSFSIERGLKFLLKALQGLTSTTKNWTSFNSSAALYDLHEPPKDHMKWLHGACTRFFMSSCILASSSRACQLPQLDSSKAPRKKKSLSFRLFSRLLPFCLEISFQWQTPIRCNWGSVASISRAFRCTSSWADTPWHNSDRFQLWQLLQVPQKYR